MNEIIEKKKTTLDNDRGWRSIEDDLNDVGKENDWTYKIIPWED